MLRRSLALAVLAAVTAAPAASAGCVEDYLNAPRPNPFVMPANPVDVSVDGGVVSVGSPWLYGRVTGETGRVTTLVDCVV